MEFRFADHVLNVARRELRRSGETVALEPQVFDLLVHLIRNRDRVVTKDDLLDSLWGGRIVSESTLNSRINAARRAVGDSGEAQRLIRTLPRKGFRFVGEATDAPSTPLTQLNTPQDRPSIAVMPFSDLSGGQEQEYFADGMVAEIITGLSRVKWLFVISRSSTFIVTPNHPIMVCGESEEPQVARSFPERADSAGVFGPAVSQDWHGHDPDPGGTD
jgi:DNA-binding winged helix-turn-helix (wHTH) protein